MGIRYSLFATVKYFRRMFLFLVISNVHAFGQNKGTGEFILEGKVIGRDTGSIVLGFINNNGKSIIDTTFLKNGKFTFKGFISEPTIAGLTGELRTRSVDDPNFTRIFLEPKRMTIELIENEYKFARITGSYSQKQLDTLNQQLELVLKELKPLDIEYTKLKTAHSQGNNSELIIHGLKEQRNKVRPYLDQIDKILYAFVLSHPNSFVSASILSDFVNLNRLPPDSAKMYYYNLSPQVRNSRPGRKVYRELEAAHIFLENKSGVGSTAPPFALNDIHDKVVRLSSFRGKNYVLLDFWASWCPLCRKATPDLIKIYKQYHANGLEMISMSWDVIKRSWSDAVIKDGMDKWYNIYLDVNDKHNFLSEKYGIISYTTVYFDR